MYRRTRKYQARHQRPQLAQQDQRPATWQPPHLRRRITIEDFDGEAPRKHTIELFRTRRIDRIRVPASEYDAYFEDPTHDRA